MILIIGLMLSVYQTYQVIGRKNTDIQLNRTMLLVIIISLIWNVEWLQIQKGDIIQLEGLQTQESKIINWEIYQYIIIGIIQIFQEKENLKSEQYQVLMINTIGLIYQMSSGDWIITITAWEQVNQSQYQQVTIGQNKDLGGSQGAGIKYFQQSAQTTGLLIQGISLLYGYTGTTNIENQAILQQYNNEQNNSVNMLEQSKNIGQFFIIIGQSFKLGQVPFHFWAPDLYDAIPTGLTMWVSILPKISISILLLNQSSILLYFNFFFLILALSSIFVGSIVLASQYRIRRFLAYSTISHFGFLIIAYISIEEFNYSYLYYISIYGLTSLLLFSILLVIFPNINSYIGKIEHITKTINDKQIKNLKIYKRDSQLYIEELKGLYMQNSSLAIALSISLFSLAGIPPLAGFFAKFIVISSIISESNLSIAIFLIIFSAVSTVNYLSLIKVILLDKPQYFIPIKVSPLYSNIISILAGILILFFILPGNSLSLLFINQAINNIGL